MTINKSTVLALEKIEKKYSGICPCPCGCSCLAHSRIERISYTNEVRHFKVMKCGHCQNKDCEKEK